jgi:hypothetical protein
MGWSRYLFLGDLGQQMDIGDLCEDVGHLRRELTRACGDAPANTADARQDLAIRRLQQENDELRLCVTVLTRAMVRKGVLTADEAKVLAENLDTGPETGQG